MNHPHHHSAKRLAELVSVLANVSAQMVELATSQLANATVSIPVETARSQEQPAKATAPEPERRKPTTKAEVLASVRAAREIIGQENRPLQMGSLFQAVSARGFVINTPKPVLTYAARLRDYRTRVGLTYLDGFGWWPVERPYPPANYTPSNVSRIGKHIV